MDPQPRSRLLTSSVALASLLFATPPAQGAPSVPHPGWLEEARGRVAAVRAALQDDSFVRRLTVLSGSSMRLPELPAPSALELEAVAALPATTAAAVAGLTAAVHHAGDLIGPLPRADVERAVAHLLRGISTLGRRQLRAPSTVARPSHVLTAARSYAASEPVPLAPPFHPGRAIRSAVENAPEAALLVAAALDRYLPALRTRGPERTVSGIVEGCDLVAQLPALCVGSTANNVYTSDASLLIDLGGDDTYRNSAGGAPFLPAADSPVYVPVSVNLDLGGDDLYEATPTSLKVNNVTQPTTLAQGSAVYGTVGILVDSAGDDVYRMTSPPPSGARGAAIIGQGSGFSAEALLVDAEGDDRYEVNGTAWDGDLGVVAQGVEVGGGALIQTAPPLVLPSAGGPAAALVDLGGGADAYAIEAGLATPAAGGARPFSRAVSAHGYGYVTTGALLDDGGRDAFRISASATNTGVDAYPAGGIVPLVQITAQGFSAAGEGLLLTGPGDTTYSVEAPSEGLSFNVVSVQGSALLGGLGVIDDQAGNDTYSVVSSMEYDREIVVNDSCKCPFALTKFNGYRPTLTNQVYAQGTGQSGAVGLLEDQDGDDSYLAVSSERLDLTLRDELTSPSRPPRVQGLGYDPSAVLAQGTGNLGAGALLDQHGRDTYEIRSLNETHAVATSVHARGEPEAIAHSSAFAFIGGQGGTIASGSSVGLLQDGGGTGDRFLASAANPVTTAPNPDGAFQIGFNLPPFHGGAGGTFVAAGQSPVIVSAPSQGICSGSPGYRGYGYWSETAPGCDNPEADPDLHVSDNAVAGHGTAPGAVGVAPSLSITGDTPEAATASFVGPLDDYDQREPRLPVGAILTAPGGAPIAGATLHFTLQFIGGTRWRNQYLADAVTGDDGVARARLPLAFNAQAENFRWRVLATYNGASGLYPRHVAKALTLATAGA